MGKKISHNQTYNSEGISLVELNDVLSDFDSHAQLRVDCGGTQMRGADRVRVIDQITILGWLLE